MALIMWKVQVYKTSELRAYVEFILQLNGFLAAKRFIVLIHHTNAYTAYSGANMKNKIVKKKERKPLKHLTSLAPNRFYPLIKNINWRLVAGGHYHGMK